MPVHYCLLLLCNCERTADADLEVEYTLRLHARFSSSAVLGDHKGIKVTQRNVSLIRIGKLSPLFWHNWWLGTHRLHTCLYLLSCTWRRCFAAAVWGPAWGSEGQAGRQSQAGISTWVLRISADDTVICWERAGKQGNWNSKGEREAERREAGDLGCGGSIEIKYRNGISRPDLLSKLTQSVFPWESFAK